MKHDPVLDFSDQFDPRRHEAASGLIWSFKVGEGWQDSIERRLERLQALVQLDQPPIRLTRTSACKGALRMDTNPGSAASGPGP